VRRGRSRDGTYLVGSADNAIGVVSKSTWVSKRKTESKERS
jgi:hypothetical protein